MGIPLPKISWEDQPFSFLAYPLRKAGEAVTKPGKVGGTVCRKEADCGIGVGPGLLQTGLYHSKQVGAAGWQCLL